MNRLVIAPMVAAALLVATILVNRPFGDAHTTDPPPASSVVHAVAPEAALPWSVPYRDGVTTWHELGNGALELQWNIGPDEAARLIAAYGIAFPDGDIRAHRTGDRWVVAAELTSGSHRLGEAIETLPPTAFQTLAGHTAAERAIGASRAQLAETPVPVADNQPPAPARGLSGGSSGMVLFRDRPSMYWMERDEVLYLQP